MEEMMILYDKAPDHMPIFTVDYGFIPRIEWLMDEEKKFKARGRTVELKHECGQSWLLINRVAGAK